MMNCGHESGDQENLAATSLATRWLAAILQEDCAWQEGLEGGEEEPAVEGEGTECLLDNQVKGEDQHKALLVLKPMIKRREIEGDHQRSSLARKPLIKLPVLVAAVLVEKMSSPVIEHHLLLVEERVHLHHFRLTI